MSFALTAEQIRARTKTVTRRVGWLDLAPGTLLQPVVKAQGLKKGERAEKIGGPIRVISVGRQALRVENLGRAELAREGLRQMTAKEFIAFFCASHRCQPGAKVTRIEFEYTEDAPPHPRRVRGHVGRPGTVTRAEGRDG